MAIIITGTPGTGKSTFAKQLSEEHEMPVVNITKLCEQHGLDDEWDAQRNCFLVDVDKLSRLLEQIVEHNPDTIIDGHLAHYLDAAFVDVCYVMKCDLKELKKRLEDRDYDEQKVRENLDCEIFDVCQQEAFEFGHRPEVVWTSNERFEFVDE